MKATTLVPLVLATAACTMLPPFGMPEAIRPAANERLRLTVPARGVQIYECRASQDGRAQWTFVAPEAELFDEFGRSIGRHGAGPSWESRDGSRIVGTVKARADAPAVAAIPWLLLETKSAGPAGAFSAVTSVQRVDTAGGVAPSAPCDAGLAGTVARVPYTAEYRFYTAR